MHYASSPSGFGSNNYKERFDDSEMRLSNARIWKKLYMPKHTLKDPADPYRILYNHQTGADLMREVYILMKQIQQILKILQIEIKQLKW